MAKEKKGGWQGVSRNFRNVGKFRRVERTESGWFGGKKKTVYYEVKDKSGRTVAKVDSPDKAKGKLRKDADRAEAAKKSQEAQERQKQQQKLGQFVKAEQERRAAKKAARKKKRQGGS